LPAQVTCLRTKHGTHLALAHTPFSGWRLLPSWYWALGPRLPPHPGKVLLLQSQDPL
jgi:hypothetical protein